jgi:hypothetical protein
MKRNKRWNEWACGVLGAALLVACDGPGPNREDAGDQPVSERLSEVLEAEVGTPAEAIHVARENLQPGDAVTVEGRIMGHVSPFVEGRAAFLLGDPEVLTACSDVPGDSCETPWDNCCDSPEDKRRGLATIEVVDADGRVLKETIEGVAGVEKLARVTVSGVVAESPAPEGFVIHAEALRVRP